MDTEDIALVLSLFGGGLLHFAFRTWLATILVPPLLAYFVLGYFDNHRPYAGGGASFYIIIQVVITIASAGFAAVGGAVIEKCFPKPHE